MATGYIDPQTVDNPTPLQPGKAAWGDQVRDDLEWLARNRPHCRVSNSAVISIPNAVFTAITFDTDVVDVDNMHSTTSNTGRVTVPTDGAGWADGKAGISFTANATGDRGIAVRLNGASVVARMLQPACSVLATSDLTIPWNSQLVAGDYIEILAYQSSGGSLNLLASSAYSPWLSYTWRTL